MRCACSLNPQGWSLPERQPSVPGPLRINPGHREHWVHRLLGLLGLMMGLWLPPSPRPRGSFCAPGSAWASGAALHAAPSCVWLLSLLLPTSLVLMCLHQVTQHIFYLTHLDLSSCICR